MTKKTFEYVLKVSISVKDLQDQFKLNMDIDDGDKTFKQFCKEYDWEALLNSKKFTSFISWYMKEYPEDLQVDFITNSFFGEFPMVHDQMQKKYNKMVGKIKKQEPTSTKNFKLSITGTKQDIERVIAQTNNNYENVLIEAL